MLVSDKKNLLWIYLLTGLFIAINLVFIINDFYWFSLVPVLLIIAYLYFFSLDKLLLIIVFCVPLSVNLKDSNWNIGVSLPTEPLLFLILVLFLMKFLYRLRFDKKISNHFVSISIIFYLIWVFFTSLSSTLPIVSIKFFIAKIWFIIPFYFIGIQLFKDYKNIKRYLWCYIIPFVGVIGYTIYNHSLNGFSEMSSHWVMTPFYNDHTAYGAMLAFFIPVLIFFSFKKNQNQLVRLFSILTLIVFITAIILSYSRAAWISLAVSFIIYLIILFKVNFKLILILILGLISIVLVYQDSILWKIEKNKQQSSQDIMKHVQSISNIRNDASNLERLNRWSSAIRIFKEHPILGSGPGTYQFLYAPYQQSKEKTRISTNAGDRGNAHSEYIGPLSESGILGFVSVILILISVIYTAIKTYRLCEDNEKKNMILAILLGLITYFVHGLLNNFLDSDKASCPFWGFIAMLVALNLFHTKKLVKSES